MYWKALLLIASAYAATTTAGDNYAEISFNDGSGQMHKVELTYHIGKSKPQFGIKYGIDLFNVKLKDCKPLFSKDIEEYFAAFIIVPTECDPKNIYRDILTHGANFVFFYLKSPANTKSLLAYDNLAIPVFILEDSASTFSFFDKKYKLKDKVYVDVFFLTVS